jgi:hypothetical protein
MKKHILLFLTFGIYFIGQTQNVTVLAPANSATTTQVRAPNGLASQTTMRAHFIITAAELTALPNGTPISSLGFTLTTGATSTAATGNLQIYLENSSDVTNLKSTTWSTAITGMTSVYNSTYDIPNTTSPVNVDFVLPAAFTYTGGSIYVAYDYLGSTFATVPATYSANSLLPASCFSNASATSVPPTTLGSTAFRPEMRFTFVNTLSNDMSAESITAENGSINTLLQTSQSISGIVKNNSNTSLSNIPVTLSITGANSYTNTQTIPSLASGASISVVWNAIPATNSGTNTIQLSVPSDQNNNNNSKSLLQGVSCDTLGFVNRGGSTGGVGFNTGTGILATRYNLPSNIPIKVKGVSITLTPTATNTGNILKGVLCNAAGTIIDSTANFTITTASLGQKINLNFINGNTNYANQTLYIGFRQVANATTGYFPLATQPGATPFNRFYALNTNGGDTTSINNLGVFMISAVLKSDLQFINNPIGNSICPNNSLTFFAVSGFSNYEFFLNSSSVQNGTSSTYTSPPINTATLFALNGTKNGCIVSASKQITIKVFNTSATANLCAGSTYTFGSQNLTTPGTYTNTFTSVAGCDSIVTLNLVGSSPSNSSISVALCPGVAYTFGSEQITIPGVYTRTILNSSGCDSLITLTATLTAVDNTIVQVGNQLSSTATNASFQWIDCATQQPITGATSSNYQPTNNSSTYAVLVTQNGCSLISDCINLSGASLEENMLTTLVKIYPNPTKNDIHLHTESEIIKGYTVLDAQGRALIANHFDQYQIQTQVPLSNLSDGSYFIQIETKHGTITKPFVKK